MVGASSGGGFKQALHPQMSPQQLKNFILRGNADSQAKEGDIDFDPKQKKVEVASSKEKEEEREGGKEERK